MIRELAKLMLFRGCRTFGVNAFMRRRLLNKVLVLNYHGVVTEDHSGDRFRYHNTVSLAEFEQHLQTIRKYFTPVSLTDIRDWTEGKKELPPYPALVTLDDGYRNNLTHAAPLLVKYRVPAVVFLSTGYIGDHRLLWLEEIVHRVVQWSHATISRPGAMETVSVPPVGLERRSLAEELSRQAKRIPDVKAREYLHYLRSHTSLDSEVAQDDLFAFLDWDQVRELHRQGVEFGAHTVEHVILTQVGSEQLDRELRQSKAEIERQLGTECFSMAYPNGSALDYSDAVVAATRNAGYRLAFTLPDQFHEKDGNPLVFARVQVPGHVDQSIFEARVCGTYDFLTKAVGRP